MFANVRELLDFVASHQAAEERNYEYKGGITWDGPMKYKIAKAILAMSNIRDGGTIVIGVERVGTPPAYQPIGMNDEIASTYDHDKVLAFANTYADPYARVLVQRFVNGENQLVAIQVFEFDEFPVICKRSYQEGRDQILQDGRLYSRTFRMAESSCNLTASEMREILQLATEKALRKELQRMPALSSAQPAIRRDDQRSFEEERAGF